ncbi:hypothetical protein [Skermanella pratensis]|uniref:hypothetical protein n=1 Tax=Skermanella pratensis TaxID=2233999 RepID=UPI001301120C|nr:hypothetical protein [Skermanella pratensis]
MRRGIGKIVRTLVACLLMLALPGASLVPDAAFADHLRHGCEHAADLAAGALPSDTGGGDCTGTTDTGFKCRIGFQCMTVAGGLPASFSLLLVGPPAGSELPPAAALLDGIDPAPVLHPPRPVV